MNNIAETIAHGIKIGAEDVAHAAEEVVGAIPKVISVLGTALRDEPAVKSAVVDLVKEFGTLTADGALAVAAKGADLTEDAAMVSASVQFLTYFKDTFVPVVEKLFGEVKADIVATA